MGVTAMAQMASQPSRRQEPDKETTVEHALRVLAAYIPSEAIATYLALLGLLVPAPDTPADQVFMVKSIGFAAGLLVAVVLVFVGFKKGAKDTDADAWRKRLLLIGFAAIAFVAYSVATPGGPWSGVFLGIAVTIWGGAVALLLAIFLPIAAKGLGLRE